MKALVIDDEALARRLLKDSVEKALPEAEVYDFAKPSELLDYARENDCDLAFLDIQMPGMTGVALAGQLREIHPLMNVFFVTGYDEYKSEAMDIHASGYVMKPVSREKVEAELKYIRHYRKEDEVKVLPAKKKPILKARCFGNFEISTMDGENLYFERSKAKELMAYLIYRRGSSCSLQDICGVLFEDAPYDKNKQSYMHNIITALIKGLKDVGAAEVIKKGYNKYAVDVNLIDCDFYRLSDEDDNAYREYNGEFMAQYPWAEFVTGYLDGLLFKRWDD